MRILGIVLIILGILMIVFNGFNYQTEKKVVDLGPIQIDKKENHVVWWPAYAGGIAVVAGIVVLATSKKNV
jgi:hypothetical protein